MNVLSPIWAARRPCVQICVVVALMAGCQTLAISLQDWLPHLIFLAGNRGDVVSSFVVPTLGSGFALRSMAFHETRFLLRTRQPEAARILVVCGVILGACLCAWNLLVGSVLERVEASSTAVLAFSLGLVAASAAALLVRSDVYVLAPAVLVLVGLFPGSSDWAQRASLLNWDINTADRLTLSAVLTLLAVGIWSARLLFRSPQ